MFKTQPQRDKEAKDAQKILWKKGILKWKLHPLQKLIYDRFHSGVDDITTMLIARQTGKSFLLAVIATEICLKKPHSVVKFVTPKLKMVKNILNKNMRVLLEGCPPEIKPEWKENDKIWQFPNGSQIQAAGTDNKNYDNIRGGTCDLWVVDEAGFASDLEEVVYSVLAPTTTMTGGKGILSSTPPPGDPEHDFIKMFVEPAEQENRLFKYTIHDNPMLSLDEIQKIIKKYPNGEKNPRFRAEYLCIIERDSESTVISEFDSEAQEVIVTDKFRMPPFYDYYLSMDIGGKDFTVVLFAYYDFINGQIVVLDEIVLKEKQNTKTIAKEILKKQTELFDEKPPYLRFADNNNIILLNDLQQDYGLNFLTTRKDNKEAAINQVRLKVTDRDIIIHPRCVTLINHLKYAQWSKSLKNGYKEFARNAADKSHYDALDALIYLVRNIVYSKNPYPANYGVLSGENTYNRPQQKETRNAIASLFKPKKSIKFNK